MELFVHSTCDNPLSSVTWLQVDHKAKEIIPKADLPSPRKEFSACAIGCKVYVTGGRGSENGVSKDVWIYDTVHEEWSKGAPMLIARSV